MPITYTPIRYPGGKSKIYPVVDRILEATGLVGATWAEPFCGGAGLAMRLLLKGRVSRVLINDLDPAVFSMWVAIVERPAELCAFLRSTRPTVPEWERQHDYLVSHAEPSLELACAALYCNRTSRSGILRAGPIGGREQTGSYGIDARYGVDGLCDKIAAISARSDDIFVSNMDAADFSAELLEGADEPVMAYFDPPYVEQGPTLYERSLDVSGHADLARNLSRLEVPWMLTYDCLGSVDDAYRGYARYDLALGYSATTTRRTEEILVTGPKVRVPEGLLHQRNGARPGRREPSLCL
jgi:DNA adenine methylase